MKTIKNVMKSLVLLVIIMAGVGQAQTGGDPPGKPDTNMIIDTVYVIDTTGVIIDTTFVVDTNITVESTINVSSFQKFLGGGEGRSVIFDSITRNIYVAGTSGGQQVFVAKFDVNGNKIWFKTYCPGSAVSIKLTSDSGCVVTGTATAVPNVICAAYLLKIDKNGFQQWITFLASNGTGDNMASDGYDVQVISSSSFLVHGETDGFYTTPNSSSSKMFLAKIDNFGNEIFFKVYSSSSGLLGRTIIKAFDGNYIASAISSSPLTMSDDLLVLKIDTLGNIIWKKMYGSIGNNDIVHSAIQDRDSNIVIVAEKNGSVAGERDIFVIKTNKNGDTLWTKIIGGSSTDWASSIVETKDNSGYVLTGTKISVGGTIDTANAILLKIAKNGALSWVKELGPGSTWYGVVGFSIATVDNGFLLTGFNNNSIFLVKTDSMGNVGCNQNIINNFLSTPAHSTLVFSPSITADAVLPVVTTTTLTVVNPTVIINTPCFSTIIVNDTIITIDTIMVIDTTYITVVSVKIDTTYVGIKEMSKSENILVYPNPAKSYDGIIVENADEQDEFALYDLSGKQVFFKKINQIKEKVNIPLSSGTYIYNVGTKKDFKTGKLILLN